MKFNKMIGAGLAILPLLANAADLKISNNTRFDLSFAVNHICSDVFDVIYSDTIKVLSEKDFRRACEYDPANCIVSVFNKSNCKGEHIAEIGLDTNHGIFYVSSFASTPISVTNTAFDLWFVSPIGK